MFPEDQLKNRLDHVMYRGHGRVARVFICDKQHLFVCLFVCLLDCIFVCNHVFLTMHHCHHFLSLQGLFVLSMGLLRLLRTKYFKIKILWALDDAVFLIIEKEGNILEEEKVILFSRKSVWHHSFKKFSIRPNTLFSVCGSRQALSFSENGAAQPRQFFFVDNSFLRN